jgi:hypothetical protein
MDVYIDFVYILIFHISSSYGLEHFCKQAFTHMTEHTFYCTDCRILFKADK